MLQQHQLGYCQKETTYSLSYNKTKTNLQQEKHNQYPLEYIEFVYRIWSQILYKYIVQKIMESITNFLTGPIIKSFRLFRSEKCAFLITSQIKCVVSVKNLFD